MATCFGYSKSPLSGCKHERAKVKPENLIWELVIFPRWHPRTKRETKPSYKTLFVPCIMYKTTTFHRGHVIPAPEQWTNSAKLRAMRKGPPYRAAFTVPNAICSWRHSRFPSVPRRRETKDIVLVCISGLLDTITLFYGALQDSWADELACSRRAPELNSNQTPTLPTQISRHILGKFRDTSLPLDYTLRLNSSVVWGIRLPRNFVRGWGGSTNSVEDRGQEEGDMGAVAP